MAGVSLEAVVEHIANVDSAIDPKNAQQVLGKFSALVADYNGKKYMLAKRMWDLGKLIASNKSRLNTAELARAFGIRREMLSVATRVAKALDLDDKKFEAKYRELGNPSWFFFARYFSPVTKKHKFAHDIDGMITSLITGLERPEIADRNYEKLHQVQRRLARVIPARYQLQDKNFVPYSPCCCCGDYAPPPETGYTLRTLGRDIKYPICDSCAEREAEPNIMLILTMYYNYAHTLENVIDKMEGLV